MFLGRNRLGSQAVPSEQGTGESASFLNQTENMPSGMQRFLAKKGINSSDELFRRVNETAPRMIFRR